MKKIFRILAVATIISVFPLAHVFADEEIVSTSTENIEIVQESATSTEVVSTSTEIISLPSPVSIFLDIEATSQTLFSGSIDVSACAASLSATPTVSAYCAVKQSGLPSEWSNYGNDSFLTSIDGIANDFANNLSWNWFSNLSYGQTSLTSHLLTSGEKLLLSIGRMPLDISVSTTTPMVGGTTTISVKYFGFDDAWNPVWLPAGSSTIKINTDEYGTDSNGQYELVPTATTTLLISAVKQGFLDSATISLYPYINVATTTGGEQQQSLNGGGGGTNNPNPIKSFDLEKAIQFLLGAQEGDGSFGGSLYSDWVAIALSSAGRVSSMESLKAYLKSAGGFSAVTDYERHAMALMSLGLNPRTDASIDYIKKITDSFDGNQIGDASLINDDIFALFPLIKAGYTSSDPIIQKITAAIISKQKSDGSWEESIDLTSAGIQALQMVSSLSGSNQAITSARGYLQSHVMGDGGFGSSFSTSWAMQALASFGGSIDTAEQSLVSFQQDDGGLESTTTDKNTRIWATAYAIPAVLKKPWSTILVSFPKPVVVENPVGGADPAVATSTVPVATSTTQNMVATSTATSTHVATREIVSAQKTIVDVKKVSEIPIATSSEFLVVASSQVANVSASGQSIPLYVTGGVVVLVVVSGLIFFLRKKD